MRTFTIYAWNRLLGTPHEEYLVSARTEEEAIKKLNLPVWYDAHIMP